MGSRIKKVFTDILEILSGIEDTNSRKLPPKNQYKKLVTYFNIWNDQVDDLIRGNTYAFGTDNACFVELSLGDAKMLGAGFTSYPDCMIRLHIVNWILDGGNGTMEQNLKVFDSRDLIKEKFLDKKVGISYCSTLMNCEDRLDYNHEGLYVYILSFNCNFIDSKGSSLDPDKITVGYLVNPNLNLNVFNVWCSGANYFELKSAVSYRDVIYLCKTNNSDELFNEDNWHIVNPWIPPTKYIVGDYICYDYVIYKCITENSDLTFVPANWTTTL